jgi:hypothetical protein
LPSTSPNTWTIWTEDEVCAERSNARALKKCGFRESLHGGSGGKRAA